jgi:hypothetical protein
MTAKVHSCCINPDTIMIMTRLWTGTRGTTRRLRLVHVGHGTVVTTIAICKLKGIKRGTRIIGNMSITIKRYLMHDTARGSSFMF